MDVQSLQPGQEFGPYRLLRLLGQGNMGVVWLAEQPSLDREVALKLMAPRLADDPIFVARFQREARTAAQLNHPHIVRVFDIGEQDGTWFLCMEYVEGEPLRALLEREGPLPTLEVARWGAVIADALSAAHERGVLHRDVKPGNVLIDAWRHARLMDFGIAKSVNSTTLTTNEILGTPNYMAPELGQGRPASPLTDQYALGVMLYELITGRVPYQGETPVSVLYQHLHGTAPLIATLNPQAPAPLIRVVARAMAREPDERFRDCGHLCLSLKAISEDKPPPLTPLPPPPLQVAPVAETLGMDDYTAPTLATPLRNTTAVVGGATRAAARSGGTKVVPSPARALVLLVLGVALLLGLDVYARRQGAGFLPVDATPVLDRLLPSAEPPEPAASAVPGTPAPATPTPVAPAPVRPAPVSPPVSPAPTAPPPEERLPWVMGRPQAVDPRVGFVETFTAPEVLLQLPEANGRARAEVSDGALRVEADAGADWRALSLRPVPLAGCELTVTVESGAGQAGLLVRLARAEQTLAVLVDGAGLVRVGRVRPDGQMVELGRRTLANATAGHPVRLRIVNRVAGVQVQANGVTVAGWLRDRQLIAFAGPVVHGPVVARFERLEVRARQRMRPGPRPLPGSQVGGTLPAR